MLRYLKADLSIRVDNWERNVIAANSSNTELFLYDFIDDSFRYFICDNKISFAAAAVPLLDFVGFISLEVR